MIFCFLPYKYIERYELYHRPILSILSWFYDLRFIAVKEFPMIFYCITYLFQIISRAHIFNSSCKQLNISSYFTILHFLDRMRLVMLGISENTVVDFSATNHPLIYDLVTHLTASESSNPSNTEDKAVCQMTPIKVVRPLKPLPLMTWHPFNDVNESAGTTFGVGRLTGPDVFINTDTEHVEFMASRNSGKRCVGNQRPLSSRNICRASRVCEWQKLRHFFSLLLFFMRSISIQRWRRIA